MRSALASIFGVLRTWPSPPPSMRRLTLAYCSCTCDGECTLLTELEACAELSIIGRAGSGAGVPDQILPYCVRADSLKGMRAVPLSVLKVRIQTTLTVYNYTTWICPLVYKVPSSGRKQCKRTDGDKLDVRDKREVLITTPRLTFISVLLLVDIIKATIKSISSQSYRVNILLG